ncbi:MAG TPA: hypothetical protein VIY48_22045 [Candidatus Paceibacterota bacterium]
MFDQEMITFDVKISMPATTKPELMELMKENFVILGGTYCEEHRQGVWVFNLKDAEVNPLCALNSLAHVNEAIVGSAPPGFFEDMPDDN